MLIDICMCVCTDRYHAQSTDQIKKHARSYYINIQVCIQNDKHTHQRITKRERKQYKQINSIYLIMPMNSWPTKYYFIQRAKERRDLVLIRLVFFCAFNSSFNSTTSLRIHELSYQCYLNFKSGSGWFAYAQNFIINKSQYLAIIDYNQ